MMANMDPVVIIGAGMSGLVAAVDLARRGVDVLVLEAAEHIGGKVYSEPVLGQAVNMGPTVLTMRWVFDRIFEAAGGHLDDHLTLQRQAILGRHFWHDGSCLDLHQDVRQSTAAIGDLYGSQAARGHAAFHQYAQKIYDLVLQPFILGARPTAGSLLREHGVAGMLNLTRIDAFRSMHTALGDFFTHPHLLQLFGRYATYCGGSPYRAPATLNLVAAVEQQGVWRIEGGLGKLTSALRRLAQQLGATIQTGTKVVKIERHRGRVAAVYTATGERHGASAVVMSAGPETLPRLLGQVPKVATVAALSACTWATWATTQGVELTHHNVFFGDKPQAEFTDVFEHQRIGLDPTVYLCAQDRNDKSPSPPSTTGERLFCLINAPHQLREVPSCEALLLPLLRRHNLRVQMKALSLHNHPLAFARRLCAGSGALYGPPPHGWRSFFNRPGCRSRVPGIYLSGGSVHPGPGLPMTALSGQLAAAAVHADLPSICPWRQVAMPGGTSMPKATMVAKP